MGKKHLTLKEFINDQEKQSPGFKTLVDKELAIARKKQAKNDMKEMSIGIVRGKYLNGVKDRVKHLVRFLKYIRESKARNTAVISDALLAESWIDLCDQLMEDK